jgi:hypothetical protein
MEVEEDTAGCEAPAGTPGDSRAMPHAQDTELKNFRYMYEGVRTEASTIAIFIGTPISFDFFSAASHAMSAAAWLRWPGRTTACDADREGAMLAMPV